MPESIRVVDAFDILEALGQPRPALAGRHLKGDGSQQEHCAPHPRLAGGAPVRGARRERRLPSGLQAHRDRELAHKQPELLAEAKPCLSRACSGTSTSPRTWVCSRVPTWSTWRKWTSIPTRASTRRWVPQLARVLLVDGKPVPALIISGDELSRVFGLLRLQALHPVHHLLAAGAHRAAAQGARPGWAMDNESTSWGTAALARPCLTTAARPWPPSAQAARFRADGRPH